jgi:hypothetical protein
LCSESALAFSYGLRFSLTEVQFIAELRSSLGSVYCLELRGLRNMSEENESSENAKEVAATVSSSIYNK